LTAPALIVQTKQLPANFLLINDYATVSDTPNGSLLVWCLWCF